MTMPTFTEWYAENESRFYSGHMDQREVAAAAWYAAIEQCIQVADCALVRSRHLHSREAVAEALTRHWRRD